MMASAGEDDSLLGSGDADNSLWDAPAGKIDMPQSKQKLKSTSEPHPTHEDNATREESLRQELASVRKVNEAIEGVLANLEKAKGNIKTVNQTVGAASSLLNTWSRILSQTEHNQRLILDPSWQGASQDITDLEEEAIVKQRAADRREQEEQERKAAALQKLEDDEKRRAEAAAKSSKTTTRGRGRGGLRGSSSAASTANTSMSSVGRGTPAHRRTTSNIGRGAPNRGRGRA